MDGSKENSEEAEITVIALGEEGSCTVDTKAIEDQGEISEGLEFHADFTSENVNTLTANLESVGVKRKHEDILHIDGSVNKSSHVEETDAEAYTTVGSLEETDNSLDTSISQEQVLSSISQACQAEINIPSALASITNQVSHEQTLLPNSTAVETREESVNQAWFTTKEDKDNFQGKGVKWRQGMWSKEENDILKENIQQYCKMNNISDPNIIIFDMSKDDRKDFYRTIAKGIKRPLFAIYRRVLRMYDRRNYIGKYTPEEVKQLKFLKEKHGNDWASIGVAMGRSASSVKDRYRLLRENCQSGKWTAEEEERLSNAVHELSGTQAGEVVTTGISWSSVAEKVQTRSEKQCRSKWLNYLNWKENGGNEWTKQDEIKLINKIYDLDVDDENMIDWRSLMANWTSVRSPQWLRSKWWALKKHIPSSYSSFREMVEYLHLNYVDALQSKIERQESRYNKSNRLPHTYGSVLRNLHRPAPPNTSSLTHTITVNSDGSIVTKGNDSSHNFTSQGRFEVLQLNNVTSPENSQNSQANQLQSSYIIHSMQTAPMAGQTYIIQQPTLVDSGTVQGEQVQISPQGVVMATVLHPHHAVRCLPHAEVNPELAQAIVQTDISGPIEATNLVQTELSVDQQHEQEQQGHSTIPDQVHITGLPSETTLINEPGGNEIDAARVSVEKVVSAVGNHATAISTIANSMTTQESLVHGNMSQNQPSSYQTGPAAIAQTLDGTELCTSSSSQQDSSIRSIQVTPLSSIITTYSSPVFSTQTSAGVANSLQVTLQKEGNEEGLEIQSTSHSSFSVSEVSESLPTSRIDAHSTSGEMVGHSLHVQQPENTLPQALNRVSNGNNFTGTTQVSHHTLANNDSNLSDSDLVPQPDLPEQFLQSQADESVELPLASSDGTNIVISSELSSGGNVIHSELAHAGIPANQVVVSINDVTMATFASSESLMIMEQDGEECVVVEEGCQ